MNKQELVDVVSSVTGFTKKDAQIALDAIIQSITKTVKNGDKVTLVGFGTFFASKRQARVGRNPKTGAEIQIAARMSPKFSPGKAFKDILN